MFLERYNNIVVKIGSNTLIHLLKSAKFHSFVEDIVKVSRFAKVTIVTSGAIALARKRMKCARPTSFAQKQALSSIGQVYLMQEYYNQFAKFEKKVGQILLTKEDIDNVKSLHNMHNIINELRKINAIPIINENDAISTDEIVIGDNDTLSSYVACAVNADLLIILTDVDGIYDSNPTVNSSAKIITYTSGISLENFDNEPLTEFGSGGIVTKIKAGNLAVSNGFHCIITNGQRLYPLSSIKEGSCTLFMPKS